MRGGRFPATTTAALLEGSLPPIREDQIPGPVPRTRHQDAGRRNDNRGTTRPVPASNPRYEDQIPGPVPRTRHQDAGRRIHHRAERSLATTTAELLEQVPSNQSRERSDSGSRRSLPSSNRERATQRAELPNPPREDQGPSPPAGPHAFTCSRPGVTFPSPPYNRNST